LFSPPFHLANFNASGPWGHMAEEIEAVESGADSAPARMRHV
jgi:hypothetical protein